LGARRQDEAGHYVHTALKINLFLNAFICGLFLVIPGLFIAVFSRDPEVLAAGKVYLRIFGLGFMFITSTIILTRVFQGAGDTLWPTIIAAVRFGFFVVASLLLGWHTKLGAAGVWASMALSSAVQLGLIGWLYSLGTWKRKHLASVDAGNNMELEVDWSE
ncbi:MAG: hypothetical protein K9N51_07225, partial [Candidatus Pacebacteria bacterium]|nr:hypothetical protein [Candidatus Paceibacterota bacterium]